MRDRTELPAKATLPSPLMLGKWWDPETSPRPIRIPFDAFADATRILEAEIADLADLGCRYVQIDATDIATLTDPDVRGQYDGLGIGAERMLGEGIDLLNELAATAPADVTMGIHLCKGNSEGRYIAAGSYEPIAARVFPRLDAYDVLLLEYDDERSGGFEPLTETLRRAHRRPRARVEQEPHDRDGRRGRRADRGGVGVRADGSPGPVLPVRVRVDGGRQQGHAGDPGARSSSSWAGSHGACGTTKGGTHVDFGLGLMGYEGSWDDARFAEEHGFSTVGFVDSPLLGGDPFVCLGLTAQATTDMQVGTFLAIPGLRTAPTAATAIATVNKIAPGRTFLGLGTGFTGRAVFGLPRLPAGRMRDYAVECRALLDGEEVDHTWGTRTNPIRLRHKDDLYVDTEARTPVWVGADGPKALAAAGEAGDGWVVTLQYANVMGNSVDVFSGSFAAVRGAAEAAGRESFDPYTVWSICVCVLEEGESATSERALEQAGPGAMMAFHAYADHPEIRPYLPPHLQERHRRLRARGPGPLRRAARPRCTRRRTVATCRISWRARTRCSPTRSCAARCSWAPRRRSPTS